MTNFTHAKYGPDTVRIDDPTYVVPLLTEDVTVGTGLAFPAADTVAIEAGGVEKARFTSTLNSLAGVTTLLANSASAALTVTQTGAGNAFVVEDSTSPDNTPFVIGADGRTVLGTGVSYTGLFNSAFLQLHNVGGNTAQSIQRYTLDAFGPDIEFLKSRNATTGSHTAVASGDTLGALRFAGSDGTAFKPAAYIDAFVDGTPGTNDMPGRLVFSTTADGASSPTERMRIDSAGNVGVGGAAQAFSRLELAGTFPSSSAITIAAHASGVIPSGTTNVARMFSTTPSTQAAAFTCSNLQHYYAEQGTIGAGSAVTNQYGFLATNTLTGATNNYGFYSNIAAAANRYNFYAAGTAANYFAGDVQLGKTVTAGGTTGAQTINKTVGTVNFAAAATSLVVTNSLVTANSIITATVGTNDTTMKSVAVVAAAGSFTLHANAAATAETRVNFHVFN
jgi:hypothetical protein